jgi:hypothetical protein
MRTKFYYENISRREETEGLFNRIILQVIIGPERNLVKKANPEFGGDRPQGPQGDWQEGCLGKSEEGCPRGTPRSGTKRRRVMEGYRECPCS